MNKPSSSPRRRRSRSPELSQITALIDDTRRLRLILAALADYPPLTEPARDAVASLQNVAAKLELIAELVSAKPPRRRRTRTTTATQEEPSFGEFDAPIK